MRGLLLALVLVLLSSLTLGSWAAVELVRREERQLRELRQLAAETLTTVAEEEQARLHQELVRALAEDRAHPLILAVLPASALAGSSQRWLLPPPAAAAELIPFRRRDEAHSLASLTELLPQIDAPELRSEAARLLAQRHHEQGDTATAWQLLLEHPPGADGLRPWLHSVAALTDRRSEQLAAAVDMAQRHGLPQALWPTDLRSAWDLASATPALQPRQRRAELLAALSALEYEDRRRLIAGGDFFGRAADRLLLGSGGAIAWIDADDWREHLHDTLVARPAAQQAPPRLLLATPWGEELALELPAGSSGSGSTFWWLAGALLAGAGTVLLLGLAGLGLGLRRQLAAVRQQRDFVSSVSHELKTPIAAIHLHAEMLELDYAADPEQRERCQRVIVREARRLDLLVANVLASARADRGLPLSTREPVDLAALVAECAESLRPAFARDAVALRIDGPPCCVVHGDRAALAQILLNLLDNARAYGGSQTQVDVRYQSNDEQVELTVADQGPGIHPRDHERIFQPFIRLEIGLRRRGRGVGLGLSLVQQLVSAHGGRVEVDSSPGRGSVFRVVLPHHEAQAMRSKATP